MPVEEIVAERADAAALQRIAAAPLVVFADEGDPWGLARRRRRWPAAHSSSRSRAARFSKRCRPMSAIVADDTAAAGSAARDSRRPRRVSRTRTARGARDVARVLRRASGTAHPRTRPRDRSRRRRPEHARDDRSDRRVDERTQRDAWLNPNPSTTITRGSTCSICFRTRQRACSTSAAAAARPALRRRRAGPASRRSASRSSPK